MYDIVQRYEVLNQNSVQPITEENGQLNEYSNAARMS